MIRARCCTTLIERCLAPVVGSEWLAERPEASVIEVMLCEWLSHACLEFEQLARVTTRIVIVDPRPGPYLTLERGFAFSNGETVALAKAWLKHKSAEAFLLVCKEPAGIVAVLSTRSLTLPIIKRASGDGRDTTFGSAEPFAVSRYERLRTLLPAPGEKFSKDEWALLRKYGLPKQVKRGPAYDWESEGS